MTFTIKIKNEMDSVQKILLKRQLNKNGEVQRFMTSEVKRISDPYTPFMNGALKNTAKVDTDKLTYIQIYSHYQWKGVSKNGKKLNYNGGPMRGPHWVERAWADRGKEVIKSVANFAGGICE
ncbi:minor capsid protein [Paraclostridium bifermentans]|uniref:minor capsid protein n=1 Tax=Paraclostridium bifermentans TaxID=1490 RepID=UPI0011DCF08B|nr:minor capsid protein [Paraclostridium bifermentans]